MPICTPCSQRRAAMGVSTKWVWTSDDGMDVRVYDKEIQAKAKVVKRGGTYTARDMAGS